MSEVHHLWLRLYRFFTSFQVELRGHYTAERIQALAKYLASTSTPRTLLISVFSPLPCLVIVALVECVPLAPTEDGSRGNAVFWGRDLVAASLMMRAVLEQIRVAVPGLGMTPLQAIVVAIVATTVSTADDGSRDSELRDIIRSIVGAELRKEMNSFANVQNCPMPIYLYGFNRLGPLGQNMYLGLLPVIKIIGKNWISYFLRNKYELMAQIMIFNLDVFNAMYVLSCIQNSKSLSTTFISIGLDAVLAWVSMTDLRIMTKRVFLLRLIHQEAENARVSSFHQVPIHGFILLTSSGIDSERAAQVLFTAEFAILVLYTKFIVPFLFATCTCILFYMPNRAYYPQLEGYDDGVLKEKVSNVAVLGVSQFVLLVVNGLILQRRLGVPVLHLLSFGLDHGKKSPYSMVNPL
ncbi:hypothetical protein PHYSODRAFT_328148 [Phytophthora sojae]|uniref:Uncharacterized protein n=1 Tax=Phytophthora sojae (strain P6497) TaxID=1094619 RepID=G4Z1X9_PHYSP|nr:hypothetical protein PHYSODRAFT_328148 [Phytophthora sojae]EGZ19977.1 hypothetical protein PHYSODRAFT_328148 [Phytophthora sojae]|eukprot:XP_009522694.1 hypothetical protein PHYSODRAFT_328148 [Phytophthora sojae]